MTSGTRITAPGGKIRPPRRKTMRESMLPWDAIRRDYVEGIPGETDDPFDIDYPTAEQLSERYSCSSATITNRMRKEGWVQLRVQQQASVRITRQRMRRKKLAGQAVAFDQLAFNTAKLGLTAVQTRLTQIMQATLLQQKMVAENKQRLERGELVELPADGKASVIDATELDRLASSMQRFAEVGRKVLGEVDEEDAGLDLSAGVDDATPSIGQRMREDSDERLARVILAIGRSRLHERIDELIQPSTDSDDADAVDTVEVDPEDLDAVLPTETTPTQHTNPRGDLVVPRQLPFPDVAKADIEETYSAADIFRAG